MVYLTRNHMKKAGYWRQKIVKNKMNDTENVGSILHPASILHPILHRKSPMYKGIFMDGCRNVGENQKKFFWGVGSGNVKHRTSLRQTSVLSRQNIGTLPQRSPMFFLFQKGQSRRGAVPVEFIQKLCQASTGRKTRDKTQESGKDAMGHLSRIPVLWGVL